jgi:hypothetical protein
MEKRIKKVNEYVLEEHEIHIVMHCLNYASHRLGTKKGKDFILRKQFSEAKMEKLRMKLIEIINPPQNTSPHQ